MAGKEEPWPNAESLFGLLQGDSKSLLKKHLSKAIFDEVKGKTTGVAGKIEHCIRSGCENLDSGVGLYACDPEAYETFAPIFDPVIKDYHKVDKLEHPAADYGSDADIDAMGDLDPSGEFVVSTRVRVGRSYEGYGFPPIISDDKRKEIEDNANAAFKQFTGDLAPGKEGGYKALTKMSDAEKKQYTEDHFLFNDHDRHLRSAGGYRNWPNNRGIYFNSNKTFLVWVNEEDHLRLISMQKGGNLTQVYKRLVDAAKKFQSIAKFATNPRLGYLTFCPTNLGTGLRASVHIKLEYLEKDMETMNKICADNNLQPRGVHGEHTEAVGSVYDISNKRRLGLTEWQAIQEMYNGVKLILDKEKALKAAAKK